MAAIRRFSLFLAIGLIATLSIKTFVAASVLRPNNEEIASAAGATLAGQGYQVAGLSSFSGRVALLAGQESCIMYFVPVSEQGWHQETVRKGLVDEQKLWFLFRGKLYADDQPRWPPLLGFYVSLALAYTGLGPGFEPVYAVVASRECDMAKVDWQAFKALPYRKESLFTLGEAEDF
ncbi:hypothetical protein [Rhizobium gallicum]|uniref:hypothetical protein n=1 Tax=Rhizobium gallicum TaxID=56730 RepID=UPI0012EB85F8|nr:hypothetical protein [Rhizobium gallicum]